MTFNKESKFLYKKKNFILKDCFELRDGLKPCKKGILFNHTVEYNDVIEKTEDSIKLNADVKFIDSVIVLVTSDSRISTDSDFIVVARYITPKSVFANKEIYALLCRKGTKIFRNGFIFEVMDDGKFRPVNSKTDFLTVQEHVGGVQCS